MPSLKEILRANRSNIYVGSHDPQAPAFSLIGSLKCTRHTVGRGALPASATLRQYFPSPRAPLDRTYTGNDAYDYLDANWQPNDFGPEAEGRILKITNVATSESGSETETTVYVGTITRWDLVVPESGAPYLQVESEDYRLAMDKNPLYGIVIGHSPAPANMHWLESGLMAFNVGGRKNMWAPVDSSRFRAFCPPEVDVDAVEDENEAQFAAHWALLDILEYVIAIYDSTSIFNDRKPHDNLMSWRTWFSNVIISPLAKERLIFKEEPEDEGEPDEPEDEGEPAGVSPTELDLTGRSFGECLDEITSRAKDVGWSVFYNGDTPTLHIYATDNVSGAGIAGEAEKTFTLNANDPASRVRSLSLGFNARDRFKRVAVIGKPDRYQSTFATIIADVNDGDYLAEIGWTVTDERNDERDYVDALTGVANALEEERILKSARFSAVFLQYGVSEDFDWSSIFETPDGPPETAYFKTSRPFLPTLLNLERGLFDGSKDASPAPVFIQRAFQGNASTGEIQQYRGSDILPPEIGAKHVPVLDPAIGIGKGGIILSPNARLINTVYWGNAPTHSNSDQDVKLTRDGPWTWDGTLSRTFQRHGVRFTVAFESDSRLLRFKEQDSDQGLLPHERSTVLILGSYQNDYEKQAARLVRTEKDIVVKESNELETGVPLDFNRQRIDIKNDNFRADNRAAAELARVNRNKRQGTITVFLDPTLQPGQNARLRLGASTVFDLGPIASVSHDFEGQSTTVTADG